MKRTSFFTLAFLVTSFEVHAEELDCEAVLRNQSVFEKVDSHGVCVVIHGVSESLMRDECRCPDASAAPIRAT